ncbi:hypothetical protein FHP25_05080 [Vineibacter terrae]|uniref:Uncharacterized protein n=1 Tax=Vineibacter terrae TaxID=2586908 RepID=A0A5C8PT47_9HYPH|nr:hypothetical protein [Vineibacter terrae]TXL80405.1 hypothetical protein FHP25_05080 [Vineibacter terrae]
MYGHADLRGLVEQAGIYRMANGWQVVIRAEWVDMSPGRPQGLSYALILQDEQEQRLLGFDNSHAADGARTVSLSTTSIVRTRLAGHSRTGSRLPVS